MEKLRAEIEEKAWKGSLRIKRTQRTEMIKQMIKNHKPSLLKVAIALRTF